MRPRPLPANTIIKFVPQQQAWIVERFGKFNRLLEPGLAILMPVVDQIKYVKTLKEVAVEIPTQSAITQDNVTIAMDGVLYYRVVDPYKASYGVEDSDFAVTQLAQTTMRSELGKLTLDKTLAERDQLNVNIVQAINDAAVAWGIKCLRYEIRDIQPPESVVKAMHSQVSAERQKRAQILESEGTRQAAINVAEGEKQSQILASEAARQEKINAASGEAEAILLKAKAEAASIQVVSQAIAADGERAVGMIVAQKYIQAFEKLAKEGNTLLLPANVSDPAGIITQAMSIYKTVSPK
jgi:regulator of protease activity HflC (stomatin/prohibitin superfamily)